MFEDFRDVFLVFSGLRCLESFRRNSLGECRDFRHFTVEAQKLETQ